MLYGPCAVDRAAFEAMTAWDKALFVKLIEERVRESGGATHFTAMASVIRPADLKQARGFTGVAPAAGLRQEDLYA
jgi:hypothetical protein